MRIVITDEESIPEWLYPGSWPDIQTPVDDVFTTSLSRSDFCRLWSALGVSEENDVLVAQGFEDVGLPHSAPDNVDRLSPKAVDALAQVAAHERWRVAERWASKEGQRPNSQALASMKPLVKSLCEFASRASATHKIVVLIPD